MNSNNQCSCCSLVHSLSNVNNCYQKNITSKYYIIHIKVDDLKLSKSIDKEDSSADNSEFWVNETTYERYYWRHNSWFRWSLIYDLQAIFNEQVYENCDISQIPLGYALLYLKKIQLYFKRKIRRRKYLEIITNLMNKPTYLRNKLVPETMIQFIISFL